jgi:tRNA-dihydrouridine synthase B
MLAPMAGVTDPPFRTMVESFGGVGLLFSEMISCRAILSSGHGKFLDGTRVLHVPNALQIVGNSPYYMAEAAKLISDSAVADIIDINFGCPVKKVVKGFAGAAAMRDIDLARDIMKAVVDAARIPVTMKMRLGWDFDSMNATTMAKIAEEAGIKMITVHARTRNQLYEGKANWIEVANVKNSVKIPVIVNGDIRTAENLKQALRESGADGAMIARGACGKPWLFKKLEDELNGREFKKLEGMAMVTVILRHLGLMVSYYGENKAIPLFRRHLNWYSAGLQNSGEFRAKINGIDNLNEIECAVAEFFK